MQISLQVLYCFVSRAAKRLKTRQTCGARRQESTLAHKSLTTYSSYQVGDMSRTEIIKQERNEKLENLLRSSIINISGSSISSIGVSKVVVNTSFVYVSRIKGTSRSNNATATQRERQKNNRFNKQNNDFARASHFYVHNCSFYTTTTWKCLISRFMENVNKQRRSFISLSELEYGPFEFHFRRFFAKFDKVSQVGIIAIETERTQIHFLRDVLFAVVSLDLKVSNVS